MNKKSLLQEHAQEKQNVIGRGESLQAVLHGISRRRARKGLFLVGQEDLVPTPASFRGLCRRAAHLSLLCALSKSYQTTTDRDVGDAYAIGS